MLYIVYLIRSGAVRLGGPSHEDSLNHYERMLHLLTSAEDNHLASKGRKSCRPRITHTFSRSLAEADKVHVSEFLDPVDPTAEHLKQTSPAADETSLDRPGSRR